MCISVFACPNPSDTPNPAIRWFCSAGSIVTVAVAEEEPLLDTPGEPPPQPAASSETAAATHHPTGHPSIRSTRSRTPGIASILDSSGHAHEPTRLLRSMMPLSTVEDRGVEDRQLDVAR